MNQSDHKRFKKTRNTYMRTKEDARVTKTKEKLYTTFISMLSEKTYEEITINDICANAGIRRATFYKHFLDKFDFSAAMTAAFINKFDAKMIAPQYKGYPIEYHIAFARKLVSYFIENERVLRLMFKSTMTHSLFVMVIEQNYRVLKERLNLSIKNGERLVASVDTVATMLAGGVGTMIVKWFQLDKPTSEECLNAEIEKMIRSVFVKL